MSKLQSVAARSFGRVDKILDAIESGDRKAEEAVREMEAAQPWDIIAAGNAFVTDHNERSKQADNELLR